MAGIKRLIQFHKLQLLFLSPRFEGCMKTPKFATGKKKLRRARLLKSERTIPGCRDACKTPSFGGKCHNGGKCVNRIVRRECDCRGTGFNGPNCSRGKRDFLDLLLHEW